MRLWEANLTEKGSFDDAIQGCAGVLLSSMLSPYQPVQLQEKERKIWKCNALQHYLGVHVAIKLPDSHI